MGQCEGAEDEEESRREGVMEDWVKVGTRKCIEMAGETYWKVLKI